ncbi:MAG: ATP-binding protein [Anaerolineaceae bacterium]|nr:ATP-binding protein [Anaerolineaceae bacterium]
MSEMLPGTEAQPENGTQPQPATSAAEEFLEPARCRICEREPICGGIGWMLPEATAGEPRPSQPLRCPHYPAQPDDERRSLLLRLSNLSALTEKRFANFETNVPAWDAWQRERMREILRRVRQFAELPWQAEAKDAEEREDWDALPLPKENGVPRDERARWLLLMGRYGSGKTHLAAAVGNRWLERGGQAYFTTSPDLLDHLRGTFGPNSAVGYDDLFQRMRNVSLLILDDFGAEAVTSWAREKLFQLLNHRYIHRLPTVFTTNEVLADLDGRLYSRLQDTELVSQVRLPVPDYRNPGITPSKSKAVLEMLNTCPEYRLAGFFPETGMETEEKQSLKAAKRHAEQYARQPTGWLLFIGGHGSGKTHLAAAIVQEQRLQGKEALFARVADLLRHLRSTFDKQSRTTYDRLLSEIQEEPLLVLDGLGQDNSSWGEEQIFQILDFRYLRQLPTLITSTLALEQHSEKLRSRLLAAEIVEIHASSYFERVKPRSQNRLS